MAYNFDKIAHTYDRLNRVMTFGLDRHWRKRAVRGLHGKVLDVACGTGDMMVCLAEQGCTVTGVDISEEMLAIARQKTASANFQLSTINYQLCNAEALPFPDATFDAVTCAFGVRNFVHLEQGLAEMLRVMKPGGKMVILELATPDNPIIKPFYNLYTRHIIPWLGKCIAGNREAYTYLPESIERFPKGESFTGIMEKLGALATGSKLTFGVCRLYKVVKNKEVTC